MLLKTIKIILLLFYLLNKIQIYIQIIYNPSDNLLITDKMERSSIQLNINMESYFLPDLSAQIQSFRILTFIIH